MAGFDLFVIGGGSGGIACARRAAGLYGVRVGIAEYNRWGGTCVNVGCVPKKIMWCAANVHEILHECSQYGFTKQSPVPLDWKYLKGRRDASVARLNGIYVTNLKTSGIHYFEEKATFSSSPTSHGLSLRVGEKEVIAKHVLIATGGRPKPLGLPGEEYTINSDQFFELDECPKRVAVVGAGYIAVELAQIFNALGAETHLFIRFNRALRKFDAMLRDELHNFMVKSGIQIHPGSVPEGFTKNADTGLLGIVYTGGQKSEGFSHILVAVGRGPNVEGLELSKIGVQQNPRTDHIIADELQNTTVKGVYALGDVCGKVELTPMAIAAGRRLADRLFGTLKSARADYEMVPTVVFSHPPLGTIGLTEEEAKAKYGEDKLMVYKNTSVNLYYNVFDIPPTEKPRTFMKLICLKEDNERIIGLHVLGVGADEMLQGFGVALKMGATKADFDSCVAIHPTASEEMVTMAPWGLSSSSTAS